MAWRWGILLVLSACDAPEGLQGPTGEPGAAGSPGRATATRVVEEPASPPCPAGGWRIEAGLDADGDGALDDDEVEVSTQVCRGHGAYSGPILEGTHVITADLDVARIASVEEITGDLRIEGVGLAAIALPRLRRVGGTLWLTAGTDVVTLDAPALLAVGALAVDAPSGLASLAAPRLATAPTVRVVSDAPALALDLSALRTSDSLQLTARVPDLRGLRGLESVTGPLGIDGLDATASLAGLESLRSAHDLTVRGLALEQPAALPALTDVAGTVTIRGNRGAALALPSLARAAAIAVTDNGLDGLSLDVLAGVGVLEVVDNPELRYLHAPRLAGADDSSIALARDPALHDVQFPALHRLGALSIDRTALADTSGLAALEVVTSYLAVAENDIVGLELPVLRSVQGRFEIHANPGLVRFSLPALEVAPPVLVVSGSPALCRTLVDPVIERLRAHGWTGTPILQVDDRC